MKEFFKKYWAWSDKINAPFYRHKHRLALYVVLSQALLVTISLLNISKDDKITMICHPSPAANVLICKEM